MRTIFQLLPAALVLAAGSTVRGQATKSHAGIVPVVIETSIGEIDVDVDSAHAPVTATNFLRYVDGRFYDGGAFFRTVRSDNQPNDSVKIAVIQASTASLRRESQYAPIPLEATRRTGLKHVDGEISMARAATPNSAVADFFICVGDQPALDYGGHRIPDHLGFAAFGRVTKGMDVVKAINAAHATLQQLTPPIMITRVHRASVK